MPLLAAVFFIIHGYAGDTEKWSREIPEPLRKAFEYRMKPRTGYLKYERVVVSGSASPTMKYVSEVRFAGRNTYVDEDSIGGILMVPPNKLAESKADRETLRSKRVRIIDYEKDRVVARNQRGDDGAQLTKIDTVSSFEVRSFGLNWGVRHDQSPLDILNDLKSLSDVKFSVREQSGILTVTAKYDEHPEYETTWKIDRSKDNSITSIEHRFAATNGSKPSSCTCIIEHEMVDSFWWPKRIESKCDESGYHETIEITSMEFDRATHPDKINLDTLNLPIGAKIREPAGSENDRYLKQYQYIGNDQLVYVDDWRPNFGRGGTIEDFASIKKRATMRPDGSWVVESREIVPKVVAPPKIGMSGNPDEWEAYVRLWIRRRDNTDDNIFFKVKHPLDEKQKNAALAILQESRPPAWNLVKRRKMEIEIIRQRLAEKQKNPGNKQPDMESEAAIDSLKVRIEELEAPDPEVEAIFCAAQVAPERSTDRSTEGFV